MTIKHDAESKTATAMPFIAKVFWMAWALGWLAGIITVWAGYSSIGAIFLSAVAGVFSGLLAVGLEAEGFHNAK